MASYKYMGKKDIYVPEWVGITVLEDAELFEVFKSDRETININRFLCSLIVGYYEKYREYISDKRTEISEALEGIKLSQKDRLAITDRIMTQVVLPSIPSRKGKNPKKLSLKPIKDMSTIMKTIEKEIEPPDSITQYLCRMIVSYCGLPFSEREKIIFKDNYEDLSYFCEVRPCTLISFRTIWNENDIHYVIPYSITTGKDDRYNYLLCAEKSDKGKQEARAYRLNRIIDIFDYDNCDIEDMVKENLDRMIEYDPQYRITEKDKEVCVRLTDAGVMNYRRIYHGRPKLDHKIDDHTYCFKCSNEQLFLYFRRFGNDAEIVRPKSLRNRMMKFHRDAANKYDGINTL